MKKKTGNSLSQNYRIEAIKYLSKRSKKPDSVLLMAIPGVGKSYFLRYLVRNEDIKKKYFPHSTFIYVDINNLSSISPLEFFRLVLKRLNDTSKDMGDKKIKKEINDIYNKCFESDDLLTVFEGLKEAIHSCSQKDDYRIILIIDRFYKICAGQKAPFFNNLKSLRSYNKEIFSYILVTTKELFNIVSLDKISELYKLVSPYTYYLKPMNKNEAKDVFNIHLPDNFPRKTKKKIESLADGYPPFIVSLIQLAAEHPDDWEDYISEDPSIKFRLVEIWDSFPKNQQDVLKSIVAGVKTAELPSSTVNILIKKGAINEKGIIFSPILHNFIKGINLRDHSIKEAYPSDIKMDESRNVVLKRGNELEKPLTSQEFGLLAHFLRNPGRICSRDEIAKEVWGEEAIEGVSDEAIDQVVSRLRLKIEDNRNKPKYIVTIRGRGFQFRNA